VQNDIIVKWANKTIIELMGKNIIKPAMNYPHNFLLKRFDNSEKIGFTDFLAESGFFSREEMDKLIKRFDDNTDAKEKIEPFISS
jgi:hypothetical protein